MAVVEELRHGECKIYICDDYIKKDEKEIQKILDAIARLAGSIKEERKEATA